MAVATGQSVRAGGKAGGEAAVSRPGAATVGRLLFAAYLVTLAVFLWRQQDVLADIVAAWSRTQTYQHGFLIVPIVLFLAWTRRERLHFADVRVEPLGLAAVATTVAIGLAGSLMDLQVVSHLALVLTVIAVTACLLGRVVCRELTFPLIFLLFAVPAGDELVPPLIDLTAFITTEGLKLFGVPVLREGPFLEVPGGRFEVARVCSGIRYLIASVAFSVLFAAMTLRTVRSRVILIAVGVVLPLVANGLRALGIVSLAYLSEMRIAVGVDHILYGWLFFCVVIAALIGVGRWLAAREPDAEAAGASSAAPPRRRNHAVSLIAVPLACLLLVYSRDALSVSTRDLPVDPRIVPALPAIAGDWSGPHRAPAAFDTGLANADGHLYAEYRRAGERGFVSAAYYTGQWQGHEIVNTENSLTRDRRVRVSAARSRRVVAPSGAAHDVVEVTLRRGADTYIGWYWYDVGGVPTTSPVRAKLVQAGNFLDDEQTPAALVLLLVESGIRPDAAGATLADLYAALAPRIPGCLWRAFEEAATCADGHGVR